MSDKFELKRGDTGPALLRQLAYSDGTNEDLTSATVLFKYKPEVNGEPSGAAVSRACTITDASDGWVTWTPITADTSATGSYLAEFEATLSDGSVVTFPNGPGEWIHLVVSEDIG